VSERYAHLVELARRQRQLVREGAWADAVAVAEEWEAYLETLPEQAPPEERPLLEEALGIVIATTATIEADLHSTVHQIEHVALGRRAIGSYAGDGPASLLDARG
jgi:hypothetical protein